MQFVNGDKLDEQMSASCPHLGHINRSGESATENGRSQSPWKALAMTAHCNAYLT